ncbi:NACHT, LRR and PYD domains-containing protein 5 [Frankliniella fusca]|uniref:NACHT, LRR and PYD domains-containing protein 5 n=1 Tax=Frankliniella fusca TaxID=407009 RepID=A0AAE1LIK1_9NEOP|nr:NACHT, LRR and PYD domains-containing protein 5 [Frankliniella fusca]
MYASSSSKKEDRKEQGKRSSKSSSTPSGKPEREPSPKVVIKKLAEAPEKAKVTPKRPRSPEAKVSKERPPKEKSSTKLKVAFPFTSRSEGQAKETDDGKEEEETPAKKKRSVTPKRVEEEAAASPRSRKALPNLKVVFPEKTHEIMHRKIYDADTPKKRIPFNIWRCPYCLFLHQKKHLIVKHIDNEHADYVRFEDNGVFDAASRMENLAGAGPRVIDEVKVDAHLQTLTAKFNRQDMAAIRGATLNILAEALVEVANRYIAWKKRFEALREDEPYESRPDLYLVEDVSDSEEEDDPEQDVSFSEPEGESEAFGEMHLESSEDESDATFRPGTSEGEDLQDEAQEEPGSSDEDDGAIVDLEVTKEHKEIIVDHNSSASSE